MAKKKGNAVPQPVTEQIPSVPNGLSGIASANAPIIFFDEAPNAGFYNGIAHITLEAHRFLNNGAPMNDRMIVAHLRMNLQALAALKNAITEAERQAQQVVQAAQSAVKH